MFGWALSFMRRRGTSTVSIDVQAAAYSTETTDPTNAYCYITFNVNGTVTLFSDTGSSYSWRIGGTNADSALYSVRVTVDSGVALDIGTSGTWQVLSSARSFGIEDTTAGATFRNTSLTIEIRRDSDSVVLDSAVVTLVARKGSE